MGVDAIMQAAARMKLLGVDRIGVSCPGVMLESDSGSWSLVVDRYGMDGHGWIVKKSGIALARSSDLEKVGYALSDFYRQLMYIGMPVEHDGLSVRKGALGWDSSHVSRRFLVGDIYGRPAFCFGVEIAIWDFMWLESVSGGSDGVEIAMSGGGKKARFMLDGRHMVVGGSYS